MPFAAGSVKPQRLRLGPWRIDLGRGTVVADEDRGKLQPKAESLLLLLCRHDNEVVTREQIFDEVWAGRVVEDAAITNSISQIRKALGESGKDILQTRSKRGYVLVLPEGAWLLDEHQHRDTTGKLPEPLWSAPILPASPRRAWRKMALVLLVPVSIGLVVFAWRHFHTNAPVIVLNADDRLSVAAIVPDGLDWARTATLRSAVQAAYLRGADVVVFQNPQHRNPFSGPHLQLQVLYADGQRIRADLALSQAGNSLREQYNGPADRLNHAVERLLERGMGVAPSAPNFAGDEYVAGRVAELRYDNLGAVAHYRRALALDPALIEAKIAMARVLYGQGRGRVALEWLVKLEKSDGLTEAQRCRLSGLLIDIAPERLREPLCPRVAAQAKLRSLELRDSLRQIDRIDAGPKDAEHWLLEEAIAILALTRLQEHSEAEARISRTMGIADAAGWTHARIELDSLRASLAAQSGSPEKASAIRIRTGSELAALGDLDTAHYH
jgi:DNA-binding winged helix-turn-helix (wHTH) protein/tetratricopeptide (TPR) repeat protein